MFYYVYQITNTINGKFYIGAHSTKKLDDGYMGSGKLIKNSIEKYGVENFSKEILGFYNTKVEMYLAEKELVEIGEHSYNLVEGGGGIDPLNSEMFDNPCHTSEHSKYMASIRDKKRKDDAVLAERLMIGCRKGGTEASKILKERGHYYNLTKFGNTAKWENIENRNRTLDSFARIEHQKGNKNSQFGTMWITDGQRNIKVKNNEEIPAGWRRGRII